MEEEGHLPTKRTIHRREDLSTVFPELSTIQVGNCLLDDKKTRGLNPGDAVETARTGGVSHLPLIFGWGDAQ